MRPALVCAPKIHSGWRPDGELLTAACPFCLHSNIAHDVARNVCALCDLEQATELGRVAAGLRQQAVAPPEPPRHGLAEFVLDCVAEDEADVADLVDVDFHRRGRLGGDENGYPTISKGRVLAECAAKRAIVIAWRRESRGRDQIPANTPVAGALFWVMKQLAVPYADRAGFREEWRQ